MLFRDLFEKYKDKIIDFKVFHPAFYFHEYDVADKFLLQIFSESSYQVWYLITLSFF